MSAFIIVLMAKEQRYSEFNPRLDERISRLGVMQRSVEEAQRVDDCTPTSPLNTFKKLSALNKLVGAKAYVHQDKETQRVLFEGVRRFAELSFATVIVDYMEEEAKANNRDIHINLTETDDKEAVWQCIEKLFIDPNEKLRDEFILGKNKGIQKVLDLLQGDEPLIFYRRDLLENSHLLPDYCDGGTSYVFPTCLEDVSVNYFYPDEEVTPTIALVMCAL